MRSAPYAGTQDAQFLLPLGHYLTPEFLLAGKAVFTLVGRNDRKTYRVKKKVFDDGPARYFVSVLVGPENTRDYAYLGELDPVSGHVRLTTKSTRGSHDVVYRGADWACHHIIRRIPLQAGIELLPSNRCARCGRLLTVPESIKSGLGPECAGRV